MEIDYHIHLHHSPCTSPDMTVSAILASARRRGIRVLGLVNHLHPGTDMEVFSRAREELDRERGDFPGEILLGAEAEMLDQEGGSSLRDGVHSRVDFVMLAMGHLHLSWVSVDTDQAPEIFLARETESLLRALEGATVDVLAHPFIYPTLYRVAPGLAGRLRPDGLPSDLVEALVKRLVEGSTALEYNCRELAVRPERVGGEPFVRSYMELMGHFRERGVNFVPGSDAHYLDQIGRAGLAPSWAQNRLAVNRKAT